MYMHSPRRVDRINKCLVARIPPTTPPFCILKVVPKTLEMEKELVKKAICFCCRWFCFHHRPHPFLIANVGKVLSATHREESHANDTAVLTKSVCFTTLVHVDAEFKTTVFLRNIWQNNTKLFALHRFRIKKQHNVLYRRGAC